MTQALAGQDPRHPANEPPDLWHALAMNRILDEMMEPSEGMLEAGSGNFKVRGVGVRLTNECIRNGLVAILQHIREGGS
jgi:hypothetical protein